MKAACILFGDERFLDLGKALEHARQKHSPLFENFEM